MKISLTLFFILLIIASHSCREIGRDISSVDDLLPIVTNKFSATIQTLRNNGKRITIVGGCEDGARLEFTSEFLEKAQDLFTNCNNGAYKKKLYFQDDIQGKMRVQVRHFDKSIDVYIPFVDTKNPSPVVITSPVSGYRYGNSILFSGKCEADAKVFIRSSYLDNVLRTAGCANGVFVTTVFLKDSVANESHIIFSLYQVDPYGNSSTPIQIVVNYQYLKKSISLDEQMVPVDGNNAVITGDCSDYEMVSVGSYLVECKNKRFRFIYEIKADQFLNKDFSVLFVEGIKDNEERSTAKVVILYKAFYEERPRFYSPSGVYDMRAKNRLVISGTCGKTYYNGSVRLYTVNNRNILKNGELVPLEFNGDFYIESSKLNLGNEERIYAECRDYYIQYRTNNIYTDFKFHKSSDVILVEREIISKSPFISIKGNCIQKGYVVLKNTKNGKVFKNDCVNGEVKFDFEADQSWGRTLFEIHEEDIFDESKSEKQVFTINYNIFPKYPSGLYVEAPSPLWGSLKKDVILYWNYENDAKNIRTYYGIYSKDSYIQAQWRLLPSGTNHIIVRGRDLERLGYKECSEVQLFLKIEDENNKDSIVVESKNFYFDFTPPNAIDVKNIDYTPLFRNELPIFEIASVDDNCRDYEGHSWLKGLQWFEVRLYKIDLKESNIDLIDEQFLINLADINKLGKKYDLDGVYQVGIVAVDMGLNKSKEYRSIMFSWN